MFKDLALSAWRLEYDDKVNEIQPVWEKQEVIFYFLSWYATPEKFSSHWYTFYNSLHKLREQDDVRVLCRNDLAKVGPFIPVLSRVGFRRSFSLMRKRALDICVEDITRVSSTPHENSIFLSYEGGVRELQVLHELAKRCLESKYILNFYNVEQWEEAIERDGRIGALIEEAQGHGVLFTSEFPDLLPNQIQKRLTHVSALPLFSSLPPSFDSPARKNRNILILHKSLRDIDSHRDDMARLSSGGWNLLVQGREDFELSNGTLMKGTGDHDEHDSYQAMLSSNFITIFLYDPAKFARKSSGKLEDVISAKSIPLVPRGSALEVQNDRKLPTFDWCESGAVVSAVEKLTNDNHRFEKPFTPKDFLDFLNVLPQSDRLRQETLDSPAHATWRARLKLIDRGSFGDFLNAALVWVGANRILRWRKRGSVR